MFKPSSAHLYHGHDYGPVYECSPCQAWVSCHKGTTTPLGRLANKELRGLKMDAHAAFDRIWQGRYARKHGQDPGYTKGMARGGRYKRLAELMEMSRETCHIGMMDEDQCRKVVEICHSGDLDE